jgi:Transposase DDE domain group 1
MSSGHIRCGGGTLYVRGYLSSDGGLLLLRELGSSLGLTRSLAACFRDAREPLFVEHSLCELLAQRVLGLAAGYEDLNDHNTLRSDPLFALAANKSDSLGLDRRGVSTIEAMLWPAPRRSIGWSWATTKRLAPTRSRLTTCKSRPC